MKNIVIILFGILLLIVCGSSRSLETWKDADEDYFYSNMEKATVKEWEMEILQ